jgi:DNA polymerase III delta subunit
VRLLLLAKDLGSQRVPASELGRRLGLSGYPLRKTIEQERRFTVERLAEMHRRLLEADRSVKRGEADEALLLEMLIADLTLGGTAPSL